MAEDTPSVPKSPASPIGGDDMQVSVASQGINYVITIGIDRYLDSSLKEFGECCYNDCIDFAQALEGYKSVQVEKGLFNEEATKDAIITRLNEFLVDKKKRNNINNNLILFFSGHGSINESAGGKRGMLISYENKVRDLALGYDELLPYFKRLETKNFLFVIDACNSGSLFDENKGTLTTLAANGVEERSYWGIASSHANETSKVLENARNSLFTSILLNVINGDLNEELDVHSLNALLHSAFTDRTGQRFFSDRINFGQVNNSGKYRLSCHDEVHRSRMIKDMLINKLPELDYVDQRDRFAEFDYGEKKQIFIFRGAPSSGLELLSKYATSISSFPDNCSLLSHYDISSFPSKETDLMLWFFNKSLDANFQSREDLIQYLTERLTRHAILFQFRFPYRSNATGEAEISKKQKDELLYELILFMHKIANSKNKLMVFLYDFENYDFESEDFKRRAFKEIKDGLTVSLVPPVRAVNKTDIINWYNKLMDKRFLCKDGKTRFHRLFDDGIKNQLSRIISEDGEQFAPALIEAICKVNNCSEVAVDLLYNQ